MVRTRMPGGVGGKAREGLPIPITWVILNSRYTILRPFARYLVAYIIMLTAFLIS